MAEWDVAALETNFEGWRAERVPELSLTDVFECYIVKAVFKNLDRSDEEITLSLLGSGNDGDVTKYISFVEGNFDFLSARKLLSTWRTQPT